MSRQVLVNELIQSLSGKSILVTGGTGFVGKSVIHFIKNLNEHLPKKIELFSLSRSEVKVDGVQSIALDLNGDVSFNRRFDYVIHAATPAKVDPNNPEQFLELSEKGTSKLIQALKQAGSADFLHVSSGAVYEGISCPESGFSENMFTSGKSSEKLYSAYARAKMLAESVIIDAEKTFGKKMMIARCFAFSGPFLPLDQQFAIGNFVRDAIQGQTINISGDGSSVRSYLDSEDLALWLLVILTKGKSGTSYNVGSDRAISIADLANKVAGQVPGIAVNIEKKISDTSSRSVYYPNINRSRSELGLDVFVDLDQSIQKMIKEN